MKLMIKRNAIGLLLKMKLWVTLLLSCMQDACVHFYDIGRSTLDENKHFGCIFYLKAPSLLLSAVLVIVETEMETEKGSKRYECEKRGGCRSKQACP